jgi:hypothetical protein
LPTTQKFEINPAVPAKPLQRRAAENAEERRVRMQENEFQKRSSVPPLKFTVFWDRDCLRRSMKNPCIMSSIFTELRLDLSVEDKVIMDVKAKEEMTEKDHAKILNGL